MSESLHIDSPFRGWAMAKACSGELRKRVIEAVEMGASRREAAELFDVSVSSAIKWLQRWRDSGSATAKPRGGSISPLEKFATQILAVIAEHPDLTLVETVALLRKRRIRTSRSSLWRFLNRHKITLKKALQAEERQRADVAAARRRWIREQGMLDPARLVFIDETAVSTNLARLRGRAPRGIRVIGHVPLGTWKTITFVAALRHNKIAAPMVVEGAMNGEMFLTYVQECLAPTLRRGDIVVMDNLQAHKVAGIQEAIESRRATLRYLPKYSPDLNPIELVYSKFKALLRKVAARTVPALVRTIRSFVPLLGTQECARYLRHAGYASV
jgi:transposase